MRPDYATPPCYYIKGLRAHARARERLAEASGSGSAKTIVDQSYSETSRHHTPQLKTPLMGAKALQGGPFSTHPPPSVYAPAPFANVPAPSMSNQVPPFVQRGYLLSFKGGTSFCSKGVPPFVQRGYLLLFKGDTFFCSKGVPDLTWRGRARKQMGADA